MLYIHFQFDDGLVLYIFSEFFLVFLTNISPAGLSQCGASEATLGLTLPGGIMNELYTHPFNCSCSEAYGLIVAYHLVNPYNPTALWRRIVRFYHLPLSAIL